MFIIYAQKNDLVFFYVDNLFLHILTVNKNMLKYAEI